MRAALLVAIAALSLAATSARAEELDFSEAPAKDWLRTSWYAVHRGDVAVGWMRRSLELGTHTAGEKEVPACVREEEVALRIHGTGGWQRTFSRMVFAAEGEQLLVALRSEQVAPDVEYARVAVRNGSRLDVETQFNGRRTRGALSAPRLTVGDELATERLVHAATGRAEGAAGATLEVLRILDMQTATAKRRTYRIESEVRKGEVLAGYRVVASMPGDKWSEPFEVDAAGRLTDGDIGNGLRVRLSTKARAQDPARMGSLESGTRVPMKAPLGDVKQLKRLVVQCRAPRGRVFASDGNQKVRIEKGVARIEVDRDGDGVEVTAEARTEALAPTKLIDSENSTIVGVVDAALAAASTPPLRVRRLLEFTSRHVKDGVEHRDLPASELLANARGDCTEHTRLFVALCRAAGIAARPVRGLVWMGDDAQAFGWHAWAEVELNGRWRPMDPTFEAMPADAARIRVRNDGPGALALGETEFHLVKAERFGE